MAFVVSGSEDGNLVWWDVQSKEILQKEEAHEGVVLGVDTWGHVGLVVSAGLDRTVRIWERVGEGDDDAVGDGGGGDLGDGLEDEDEE